VHLPSSVHLPLFEICQSSTRQRQVSSTEVC